MNVHHLELFYYVARHGGITSAVRKMPNLTEQLSGESSHGLRVSLE